MHADPIAPIADATRRALAAQEALGAGNALDFALGASRAPESVALYLQRPLRALGTTYPTLSLAQLDRLADAYARRYAALGVGARAPVALYFDNGVDYFVHFFALARLGAVTAPINGDVGAEVAAAYARRIGATHLVTDAERARRVAAAGALDAIALLTTARLERAPQAAYERHRHAAADVVLLSHTSGTTGTPKAVVLEHRRFFHGLRTRLAAPARFGGTRLLSNLPHSHNCGIAYLLHALLCGTPVFLTADRSASSLAGAIAAFRPDMVLSFPDTLVALTDLGVARDELATVDLWLTSGDAAHEPHIRWLLARGSAASAYADSLGSSEMGSTLFRNVHTRDTHRYRRRVGPAMPWVEAAVFDPDGRVLPQGSVGLLGVRAPCVTPGYWSDAERTAAAQLGGFFLTGDLARVDPDGVFQQLDRTSDVVATRDGPLYSLLAEELLLTQMAELLDCSVVARRVGESDEAVALWQWRRGAQLAPAAALARANAALRAAGLPPLSGAREMAWSEVPRGVTGKVLKRLLRERLTVEGIGADEARA
jgi:acyl-coenzyme A synthetase/AMP-(fatty) acid ligase